MESRPNGVTVVAVAAAVLGLLALFSAVVWWGTSDDALRVSSAHLERLLALVYLVGAVVELTLAWGVWSLRSWAWPVGVAVDIVLVVLAILRFGNALVISHVVTIVLAGIALYFLFTPPVRAALKAGPSVR